MTHVYIVQHTYEFPAGVDNTKFIGVYSTELAAQRAVTQLKSVDGFRAYPEGFCIDRYEIDKTFWSDGFVRI
jgi:homoserine kinase type II